MSKKGNIPKLRFPEFQDSGEWESRSIQSLLDNKYIIGHLDGNHGALYPKSEEFTKSGIPYISANDFLNGFVDFRHCKFLSISRAKQFKKGIARNGDILFAHNATVGPVAKLIMTYDYVILSTTATYFRCDNHLLVSEFLKFTLSSPDFVKQYTKVMSQSTRNQVPITTQRKFNLSLPSLPEQQRIADCLTSLDEVISNETAKLEAYKSHKKGLMQKLFPGEGELVPEWRFPEFQNSGEWEEKRLGELGNLKNGANFSSNKKGSGILTVDVLNMYGTGIEIKLHSLYRVDIEGGDYHLEEGDILFVRSSLKKDGVGWASIFTGFNEQIIYCGFLIRFRLNSHNNHKPVFLLYFFRSDIGREKIISLSGTGGITNISQNSLSTLSVPLPSLPEQQKIADCLTSLDDLISAQASKIEKLKLHKKGLMQGLFPAGDEG